MSQPIWGQGGHLVFPICPKNTNLVEGVEILLPVKFRWILFSGFIGWKLKMWKLTTTGRRTDDGHTFGSGALIRTEFYINTKMFKKHITSSGHCIGFDCFVDLFRLNYSLVISQLGSRRYSISETYWRDLSLLGHCSLYRIIRNCIANMYTSFNSFEFNFLLNVILQISIISLCKVVCV